MMSNSFLLHKSIMFAHEKIYVTLYILCKVI